MDKKELDLAGGNNSMIDLQQIGLDRDLTDKQKLFVFWYTCELEDTYHNGAKSARQAGYSEKTARQQAHKFLRSEKIRHNIEKIDTEKTKMNLRETYFELLHNLKLRAFFNVLDCYENVKYIDKHGNERNTIAPKPPCEIDEKIMRHCVTDIEIFDNQDLPFNFNYRFIDKEKAQNKIIDFYFKYCFCSDTSNKRSQSELELHEILNSK